MFAVSTRLRKHDGGNISRVSMLDKCNVRRERKMEKVVTSHCWTN